MLLSKTVALPLAEKKLFEGAEVLPLEILDDLKLLDPRERADFHSLKKYIKKSELLVYEPKSKLLLRPYTDLVLNARAFVQAYLGYWPTVQDRITVDADYLGDDTLGAAVPSHNLVSLNSEFFDGDILRFINGAGTYSHYKPLRTWTEMALTRIKILKDALLKTPEPELKQRLIAQIGELEDVLADLRYAPCDKILTKEKLLYFVLVHEFTHTVTHLFRNSLHLAARYLLKIKRSTLEAPPAGNFLKVLNEEYASMLEMALSNNSKGLFPQSSIARDDFSGDLLTSSDFFGCLVGSPYLGATIHNAVRDIIKTWLKEHKISEQAVPSALKKILFYSLLVPGVRYDLSWEDYEDLIIHKMIWRPNWHSSNKISEIDLDYLNGLIANAIKAYPQRTYKLFPEAAQGLSTQDEARHFIEHFQDFSEKVNALDQNKCCRDYLATLKDFEVKGPEYLNAVLKKRLAEIPADKHNEKLLENITVKLSI